MDGQHGDFHRRAEPAHGLAVLEILAHLGLGAAGLRRERRDAAIERWRIDCARADGVGAHAATDEIGGDRLGQPDHRGLGCAVGMPVGETAHGGSARGDIDDRTLSLRQHARDEGAHRAVHRLDVDVEGEIPFLVGAFQHRAVVHEPGGVDEDVDRSGLRRQRLDRGGGAYVDATGRGAGEIRELCRIQIGRPDLRALIEEGLGDCSPDALPRRRDDSRLSLEPACHSVLRVLLCERYGRLSRASPPTPRMSASSFRR